MNIDEVVKLVTTLITAGASTVGTVFAAKANNTGKEVQSDLALIGKRLGELESEIATILGLLREMAERQLAADESRSEIRAQLDVIQNRLEVLEEGPNGFGQAGLASA